MEFALQYGFSTRTGELEDIIHNKTKNKDVFFSHGSSRFADGNPVKHHFASNMIKRGYSLAESLKKNLRRNAVPSADDQTYAQIVAAAQTISFGKTQFFKTFGITLASQAADIPILILSRTSLSWNSKRNTDDIIYTAQYFSAAANTTLPLKIKVTQANDHFILHGEIRCSGSVVNTIDISVPAEEKYLREALYRADSFMIGEAIAIDNILRDFK